MANEIANSLAKNYLPWRSARLAAVTLSVFLFFGLPIFLRMPPWCDQTLYDVAAANILAGGTHYKDVFDTNLPGYVWMLTGIRALFGWSYEVIRFIDLLVVAGIVYFLDGWMKRGGASVAARWWMLAGVAAFYLGLTEHCHIQRDTWMLLPSLAAVRSRWGVLFPKIAAGNEMTNPQFPFFRTAFFQGLCWGVAIWIKPHVIVPAAAVWFATLPAFYQRGGWRSVARDFLGNMLGALLLGSAGIGYLVASGTWGPFVEVFTVWNSSYADFIFEQWENRVLSQNSYFPPWSYFHAVAIPFAVFTLIDICGGRLSRWLPSWLWAASDDPRMRWARGFLASLYLGWIAQALFLQREFHYVHLPEVLLMLALFATQRWAAAFLGIFVVLVASALIALGWFDNGVGPWPGAVGSSDPIVANRHPITEAREWRRWPGCWKTGLSEREYYARMWSLSRVNEFHPAPNWVELEDVVEFLKTKNVGDREVIAWNESPHALYLMMNLRPGIRFQHLHQIRALGDRNIAAIEAETREAMKQAKYIVIDLFGVWLYEPPYENMGTDHVGAVIIPPPGLYLGKGAYFPFDYPAVFRSKAGAGRYLVCEIR